MGLVTYEVEPSGEKADKCECCGSTSHTVWGYVHERDGATRAVYYVGWAEGHEERVIWITLGLGAWGQETTESDRRSVALEGRTFDGEPWLGIVDEPHFDYPHLLGDLLSRQEALDDPCLTDLWAVTDAVVVNDSRVAEAWHWLQVL